MGKTASVASMEAEASALIKVLQKRSVEDQELFTGILAEARAEVEAEAGENGSKKALWTKALPSAYKTFCDTKLTEAEAEQVEALETAIAEAEAEAKKSKAEAGSAEAEAQFVLITDASPVERAAAMLNASVKVTEAEVEAEAPHLAEVKEKSEEKWVLESKKDLAAMEDFRSGFKGSGRTVEKKQTLPFDGVWLTTLSEARGAFCYVVSSNSLYHRSNGQKLYKLLGKIKATSPTGLQRVTYAITDKTETTYDHGDLDTQKEAFVLVKERFTSVNKVAELKQWGSGDGGWTDAGGSDKTRHLTYDVTHQNYDVSASEWVQKQGTLPKPLKEALDVSRPQKSAAEQAELSATAKKKAAQK